MSCQQTIVKYTDTALPTTGAAVTLFNSVTAFPPGGCFHLLGLQWFQWSTFFDGATGSVAAVVTGQYSDDKGVSWRTFYTSATLNDDVANEDEVYVGLYKDVRFTLATSNEDMTVFSVNLALNPEKATSKFTATDVLVNALA